ncbi:MAG: DUF4276 family protein [Chloroflexota bacterium]|nr:DUF4276 family protein [Chloroflexota bacterium]
MRRIRILAEGTTEEAFVKEILSPHLQTLAIYAEVTVLSTKVVRSGGKFRGGVTSFAKFESDLRRLLADRQADCITMMIDFYGLAGLGFPGWDRLPASTARQKVDYMEQMLAQYFNNRRFIPYFALHEFEAMLFADISQLKTVYPMLDEKTLTQLKAARDAVPSPEDINLEQPPSKRIRALVKEYDKVTAGNLVLLEVTLPRIRQACSHFDQWLTRLEALA